MKGNLSDGFVIMSLLFGAVFALIFIYPIASGFLDRINLIDNEGVTNQVVTEFDRVIGIADKSIPALYVLVSIVSIISASRISANPGFFIFMIIVNLILVLGWYILNEIYTQVINSPEFSDIKAKLTWIPLIIQYVPMINVVVMMLIAYLQYMKGG